ncbi:hypothetical protein J1N10_18855 [Carboxylicivirga sp. A043]|uniref:YncE family protein n=1 Tax=Carboxylicivirga litoralis TaxID=2816963 RepID=UPI0021CB94C7|nr:DUF5074 domain-containing protein [Carboxylicivirga sp. A043]MCU4158042.1 hypothetical protein [Carboxylicivirga sp. A043]
MKKVLKLLPFFLMAVVLFSACSDDDDVTPKVSSIYVLNEGNDNGSISIIDENNEVTNNYFEAVNGLPLGKYPQSMAANDTHVFIVVTTQTGAGYVEIVDKETFKHVALIEGFSYPREITLLDGKAYVSNGTGADASYAKQTNEIYSINLTTFEKGTKISVGAGPEKMVVSNGKLYVANSGGWSNDDNTITVVDTSNDQVIETITVKACPKDMVVDRNGDVWVYCGGAPDYSNWPSITYANAGISKITASTSAVTSWDLAIPNGAVKSLAISKNEKTVYYIADAVYAMDIDATELPTTKFIDATYYGIDVHPNSDELWLCKEIDATTPGTVFVYSNEGIKQYEYKVGAMPNSTVFAN